jgi:hypothetical protein
MGSSFDDVGENGVAQKKTPGNPGVVMVAQSW